MAFQTALPWTPHDLPHKKRSKNAGECSAHPLLFSGFVPDSAVLNTIMADGKPTRALGSLT